MKKPSVNNMPTFKSLASIIGLAVAVSFPHQNATAAQAPVDLGAAATFGVLAATSVTTVPTTTVNGNLGVSPGNTVTGTPVINGVLHLGDPTAAQAQLDLTSAYNDAAGRTVGVITVAGNLGGQNLAPGLYKSTSSLEISSGDLTLDALGDTNAIWIFQMESTLVSTVGRRVILSGGAQAANIFWQIGSSATLGASSDFKGNILAYTFIAMNAGATLDGRALALHGTVTLDSDTVGLKIPAGYVWHRIFGWLYDAGSGWHWSSAFGWMWFSPNEWIYSNSLKSWVADMGGSRTLWSLQFRWLTPSEGFDDRANTSTLGRIHVGKYNGAPISDGWVVSDCFGFVWPVGDGVWFFSDSKGWLGVTPEGGIWCVNSHGWLPRCD